MVEGRPPPKYAAPQVGTTPKQSRDTGITEAAAGKPYLADGVAGALVSSPARPVLGHDIKTLVEADGSAEGDLDALAALGRIHSGLGCSNK